MDISLEVPEVNRLLALIRARCDTIEQVGRNALDHAIEAGKDARRIRDELLPRKYPGKFRGWLEDHGLKRTQIYDYILLANNEESVRRAGHTSIRAALRALRARPPKDPAEAVNLPSESTNPVVSDPIGSFDPAAIVTWLRTYATAAERLEILAGLLPEIGVADFRAKAPQQMLRELSQCLPRLPTVTARKRAREARRDFRIN
jgi:hypothetical protein